VDANLPSRHPKGVELALFTNRPFIGLFSTFVLNLTHLEANLAAGFEEL